MVAQLVEALQKVAISIADGIIVPGVDSSSNRNEYQEFLLADKSSRCVGLTPLPPSCADCLEIMGASTSSESRGPVYVCKGLVFSIERGAQEE
jgi:hypothetical protein